MASSETGQLIQAVNRLTQTVQDKIADIDSKVDSVANDIRANTGLTQKQVFYVDAETGDDSATGSAQRPFKTVKKALSSAYSGAVCTIRLQRNQRHIIEENVTNFSSLIEFRAWGRNADTTRSFHYDASTPILDIQGGINTYGSLVFGGHQESLIIELNDRAESEFWGGGAVTIARSRLVLNLQSDKKCFFGERRYLSPNKVTLREAEIEKNQGYLAYPCQLVVDSSWGFEYVEDLILGANKDNTLSNVPFKS